MFAGWPKQLWANVWLGLLFWIIGFVIAWEVMADTMSPDMLSSGASSPNTKPDDVLSFFIKVFINNVLVACLAVIGGFLTGGLFTALLFTWNGFMLGITVKTAALYQLDTVGMICNLVFHAPLEIFAFCCFGAVGFKGFFLAKKIVKKEAVSIDALPQPQLLLGPLLLLLVAAIIETFVFFLFK